MSDREKQGCEIRVMLMMGRSLGYTRSVLRGVRDYARSRPHWCLRVAEPTESPARTVRQWKPNGVIGFFNTPELLKQIDGVEMPAVSVSGALIDSRLPRVGVDNALIGRRVAQYFLDRGYQNFGFVGNPLRYSMDRQQNFVQTLQAAGFKASIHNGAAPTSADIEWSSQNAQLGKWLRALPKPAAVMTVNDLAGMHLLEAARIEHVMVPEQISIVGVDNDDLLCELADTPLSSVSLPTRRLGYEAAGVLDRLLDGKPPPQAPILLPPVEVVTRRSSDMTAIADAEVATALRFIHANAADAIGVEDVTRAVAVSRRTLESRFRKVLGRSPLAEIRRSRLERVKDLLANTEVSMPVIAQRCGFNNPERLAVVFHEQVGMTSTAYRRQYRLRE